MRKARTARKTRTVSDAKLDRLIEEYVTAKCALKEKVEQEKVQTVEVQRLAFFDLLESAWRERDGECVISREGRDTVLVWPVPGELPAPGYVSLFPDDRYTNRVCNCTITNTSKSTPGRRILRLSVRDTGWNYGDTGTHETLSGEKRQYEDLKHMIETSIPALLSRGEKAALPGVASNHPMLLEAHRLFLDRVSKEVTDLLHTVDAFIECTESEKESYQTLHDNLPSPLRKIAALAEEPEFKSTSRRRNK